MKQFFQKLLACATDLIVSVNVAVVTKLLACATELIVSVNAAVVTKL